MLQAEEVANLGPSAEARVLSSGLQITSKLFPEAHVAAGDSSHDEDELLGEYVIAHSDAVGVARVLDLDSAAIAVAEAAGRVHAYAPSPSVQAAMSWMAAIRGSTSGDPTDKATVSNSDDNSETEDARKRKFNSIA